MRKEMLVKEASPRDILVKYGMDSLESAFLKLCCSQETKQVLTIHFEIFEFKSIVYVYDDNDVTDVNS